MKMPQTPTTPAGVEQVLAIKNIGFTHAGPQPDQLPGMFDPIRGRGMTRSISTQITFGAIRVYPSTDGIWISTFEWHPIVFYQRFDPKQDRKQTLIGKTSEEYCRKAILLGQLSVESAFILDITHKICFLIGADPNTGTPKPEISRRITYCFY